jgi:tRNA threonylcarbamoyladenosine biosynthesis protein TsaB
MKILAVDTATKTCSIAIIDNTALLAELTINHRETHTIFLMGMIRNILEITRLSLNDIKGFAVSIGPGSFTGLRIGLSSIKGLSMATGKPVVGVSTIDALVHPLMSMSKCICAMIDARKGQVYTAYYRYVNGGFVKDSIIRSIKPNQAVKDIVDPCIFVGDGALLYRDIIEHHIGDLADFAHPYQHIIHASVVAHLSISRFLQNDTDDMRQMIPLYVRKSEAEINKAQA